MRGRGGPGRVGLRRGMRQRGGSVGRGALSGRGAARGAAGGRGKTHSTAQSISSIILLHVKVSV